jgi:hypothetical protein
VESNEARKRRFLQEVNERIRVVNASFAVTDGNVQLFCECGRDDCLELLLTPASVSAEARGTRRLFARPGHEHESEQGRIHCDA